MPPKLAGQPRYKTPKKLMHKPLQSPLELDNSFRSISTTPQRAFSMIKRSFLTRQLPKIVSILMLGLMGTIELSIIQAVPAEARLNRPGRAPKPIKIRPRRKPVRFRVGVKPAPYRVSAISRSDQCDVGSGAQVVVPPEKMSDRAQPNEKGFLEQTTSAKPTFFIYLPQSTTSAAKLTVKKGRDQLDRVTFDLDAKSGIVAIPMSSQGKSLEVGQKYLWQMTIYCDSSAQIDSVTLSGWVERVAIPTPPQDLQERVRFYAENGIWQDAMGSLVQLRQQGGETDWAKDWTELMNTAELSQFKNADLVQVVTAG
jgi:Domain of Unknown Function (DUF928)